MANRRRIELKVVLETNSIWVDSESDLLRREISDLVKNNTGDAHLAITWILPEVVLNERIYQMQQVATQLLPQLRRLERVIGHPFNITEEVVNKRITERVAEQISSHKLSVQVASYNDIDWPKLVEAAVNRRPPFEKKSEKGFRDAIIAETFGQIVAGSPSQTQRCRLVFLTSDKLLTDAVQARLTHRENVFVKSSAADVLELINTLLSDVGEKYIASIQPLASEYFLKPPDNTSGLFYDLDVRNRIQTQFEADLAAKPAGADRRKSGIWTVSQPRFVRKDRQRIYWTNRITIAAKAYKRTLADPRPLDLSASSPINFSYMTVPSNVIDPLQFNLTGETRLTNMSLGSATAGSADFALASTYSSGHTLGSLAGTTNDRLIATGESVIDVHWSASLTVRRKFSQPRIESLEFVETSWELSSTSS